MSDTNDRFKHESLQDAKTLKSLLTSLAKGFSKEGLTLGDENSEITLKPEGLMSVRIRAEQADGNSRLSLNVSWSDGSGSKRPKRAPWVES